VLPRSIDRLIRRRKQRVRVYFGTRQITVDLLAGARRPQMLRGVAQPIETPGGLDAAAGGLGEALRALRAEVGDLRGLPCEVVLADAWVIYDVVSIDLLRVKPPAAQAAVAATLEDIAGVHPGSLVVRWQWQRDGHGIFAMAIPRVTLGKVKSTLGAAGLDLRSVTGEFVAVYNAQRNGFTGRRVVFAVGREAGAQIAVLIDGIIRATRFELAGGGSAGLANAAAGVMRARGDDTTAPTDYVLDALGDDETGPADPRWERVRPPTWVVTRQATVAS
jgi:hypothetical protein